MKRIILAILFFLSWSVNAADCFDSAGKDSGIDPDLLRAIAFRESAFRHDVINRQSSEQYAVGLMQIHSQNFRELSEFGINPDNLIKDPCLNIYTGTYYLAKFIALEKNIWRGVGAYNAGRKKSAEQEKKRLRYSREVYNIYLRIKNQQLKTVIVIHKNV